MKTKILSLLVLFGIFFTGCKKDKDEKEETQTGTIEFRTINPLASLKSYILKNSAVIPALKGDTTTTHTTSFLFCVGDVWVSRSLVKAGQPDTLTWIRLTSSTNTELKLFEDYSFSAVEIPAGTYQSIKITLRNIFYRHLELVSDPAVTYELLETMGSWTTPCDSSDTTWATTNYFGPDGNHKLTDNVFELVSEGEKLGGFTIEAEKTAVVSWRLGAGSTTPCTTYLIDENHNLQWDCGTDRMEFACPPDAKYMWDFVVYYIAAD